MRHWHLGFPLEAGCLAHRPPRHWLTLFQLTHRPGPAGWERAEWPDGRPLLAQPWPLVVLFRIIADEADAIQAERARQHRRRG